jgi:hypothetical protein
MDDHASTRTCVDCALVKPPRPLSRRANCFRVVAGAFFGIMVGFPARSIPMPPSRRISREGSVRRSFGTLLGELYTSRGIDPLVGPAGTGTGPRADRRSDIVLTEPRHLPSECSRQASNPFAKQVRKITEKSRMLRLRDEVSDGRKVRTTDPGQNTCRSAFRRTKPFLLTVPALGLAGTRERGRRRPCGHLGVSIR